ncbi:MAG: DNA polymerase/3'-5' exonuclease PolX [Acidobacteriota bacterium]|nr:DNA polymerase/3'-5' exonuclease PolX [Acidobacteriota bacterium]
MDPTLSNAEIADALSELADLYELDGAVVHRVLAYRAAARAVRESAVSVADLAIAGRAIELPGVGATIQEKIGALLASGVIPAAARLRARFPAGLVEMTRLPGLGPRRARLLHDELGIASLVELREAAVAQRIRTVRGLGPKLEARLLEALEAARRVPPEAERVLLPRALELASAVMDGLRALGPRDLKLSAAGSARRGCDSVKDIDLIATTARPAALLAGLGELAEVAAVTASGSAGARARLHAGPGLDLRVGAPSEYGNLLQHFTGSAAHNAALRERMVRRGLHVSEHGVLDDAGGLTRTHRSERALYRHLGMSYIEPELREDRGELEAAGAGGDGLPRLLTEQEIRGDLHCHTTASDGRASIAEMALAARERGYEYLAITDHSASHGFGNAVSAERLRRQIELVGEANETIEGIEVLAGSEVNILPDGALDYADDVLARLDWVIASVHTAFGMPEGQMTARVVAAIEHPLVDAIAHPTGRLIGQRRPYALDMGAVIEAAAANGTMLEINANARRRDLSEIDARAAARSGVPLVINSDAHAPASFDQMRWGVLTARRAWLRAGDVANTRTWAELASRRKRSGAQGGRR